MSKNVSLYTKYPNSLHKIFTGSVKVNKNIITEESNDIQIVYEQLLFIDPSINPLQIKENLNKLLSDDPKSFEYQNLLREEKYKSNDDLMIDLNDPNYYLTPYDLKLLSLQYKVGFILYTNRYKGSETKFETLIIIHKELRNTRIKELSLPMICFYQDFGDDEVNNKELKPIEINEKSIIDLVELQRNTAFKKVLMKTYKI